MKAKTSGSREFWNVVEQGIVSILHDLNHFLSEYIPDQIEMLEKHGET